ncbi:conserved hypothetical protein [Cupriavidus oxalaticus]|uniref:Uncharacterized protein n=1 Tax=Cupriavidus oxalaticus TaxID=96344 RepID=A0A976G8L1_9BURK|nr:conserved hypothetical protein [Cupriavidus oxalaticus]
MVPDSIALPVEAGFGVDAPVSGAVAAVLAGVESPPPPPHAATVTNRQASGTAASFMWMRFMDVPRFPMFKQLVP